MREKPKIYKDKPIVYDIREGMSLVVKGVIKDCLLYNLLYNKLALEIPNRSFSDRFFDLRAFHGTHKPFILKTSSGYVEVYPKYEHTKGNRTYRLEIWNDCKEEEVNFLNHILKVN